jgi:NAD(P)H-hydrate epimerase
MREADRRTIEDIGVPSRVLMESAGRAVVAVLEDRFPDIDNQVIGIVCGKGNNGGDGLVVLRTLAARGYHARAWVLAPFEDLTPDSIANLQAALKLGLAVEAVETEEEWDEALIELNRSNIVVDALLGTGLTKAARGIYRRAIEDINRLDAYVVAVDVPSGLPSDSGRVPGEAIRARLTVALAAPKVCHFVAPACECCGDVEVVDIGIPNDVLARATPALETIEASDVRLAWPERASSAHKGSFGHLLVLAGSARKTGAAVLVAEAALRVGSGLVTVASAESAIPRMASSIAEVMWEPLPETPDGSLALDAREAVLALVEQTSAIAIGPGLGTHEETARLVRAVASEAKRPLVIDADGLNAFVTDRDSLPSARPIALTPHPGEAGRLLGCSSAAVQRDRLRAARGLAASTGTNVLLKGFRTLVAQPAGPTYVNLTGNPGMATAGSGDVLTGMVGSLLAQGADPVHALRASAYAHGLAADLAAAEHGQTSLIARDIIAALPKALGEIGVA